MLQIILVILGLMLLLLGARGVVSLVGGRRKGRAWRQTDWAVVIGWFAMLGLFLLILINLYVYPTVGGGS